MAFARPVLLVVDVVDGGREDPEFEIELQLLTASVVTAATGAGFVVDRVPAAQVGAVELERRFAAADAVVVTGGEDVDPQFYGGRPDDPHRGQSFPEADRAQIAVVRRAVESRTPLVGICRGIQLVNVALGGDLVQHLDGHVGRSAPGEHLSAMIDHRVALEPGSALARILGAVEAVEHESAPLWCVQWHPEDAGSRGTVLTDLLTALSPSGGA